MEQKSHLVFRRPSI